MAAAVLGREFTRPLVDRLAESREGNEELLRELTALELIVERRRFPELAYAFKHALTQDVAYASLLVQRRKELRGRIGQAIEELYADRLAEHHEVLAHHFSHAEDWARDRTTALRRSNVSGQRTTQGDEEPQAATAESDRTVGATCGRPSSLRRGDRGRHS